MKGKESCYGNRGVRHTSAWLVTLASVTLPDGRMQYPMGKKFYTCPRSSGFGQIYACPILSCGVSNMKKKNSYPEWGQEPVRLIYANPTFLA